MLMSSSSQVIRPKANQPKLGKHVLFLTHGEHHTTKSTLHVLKRATVSKTSQGRFGTCRVRVKCLLNPICKQTVLSSQLFEDLLCVQTHKPVLSFPLASLAWLHHDLICNGLKSRENTHTYTHTQEAVESHKRTC